MAQNAKTLMEMHLRSKTTCDKRICKAECLLTHTQNTQTRPQHAHNRKCAIICQQLFNGLLLSLACTGWQVCVFLLLLEDLEEQVVGGNKKMIKIQTVPNAHAKFMAQDGLEGI